MQPMQRAHTLPILTAMAEKNDLEMKKNPYIAENKFFKNSSACLNEEESTKMYQRKQLIHNWENIQNITTKEKKGAYVHWDTTVCNVWPQKKQGIQKKHPCETKIHISQDFVQTLS